VREFVAAVDDAWPKAAEKTLSENRVRFALLEMSSVLLPEGVLSKLRGRGYTVLGPGDAAP
jgi:hypothetical protein